MMDPLLRKENTSMLWLTINRSLSVPLIQQIYQQIRELILQGKLQEGEKLPSTRALAEELAVSRNVVIEAYDQLASEGFIETNHGSGTFVAEGTYLKPRVEVKLATDFKMFENSQERHDLIDFRSGIPALNLLPQKTLAKLSYQLWNDVPFSVFGYDLPAGRPELRNSLAKYLEKTRGVHCHPNQLVITSGATQALTIVGKLLLSAGDEVLIEDPITNDIQTIFKSAGALLFPVSVDKEGMKTSLLPQDKEPKFVFVTPSHQFPLGGILPIQRRIELINYAREKDCYLVEDDYDSEFRYEGSPIHSLQGLEPERVLYIGSFSKILSPALRMGYVILPKSLIERCRNLKWFTDLHTPSVNQLILARFIEEGYLERHIAKMKKVYRWRRDFFIACLKKAFTNRINIFGASTGLHLIAEFQELTFTKPLIEEISHFGVKVYSVEDHAIVKGRHENRLILGYGHLTKEELKVGVSRLKQAIEILK